MADNELMNVKYDTVLGEVELDYDTVKKYLVKGSGAVTDQEVKLFIMNCKMQKLNPFVTGEVYLIKFGSQPAQMVVGYDTYKRRAEDNPQHLYVESGIVVVRGKSGEIVQKAGACLYPSESLIGGWCRVHKKRGDREVTTFKEVGFQEYDKGNAIWKEKPCTMIEKVAISQCLREAYPKDFEGLYTPEEVAPYEYNGEQPTVAVTGEVIESTATEDPPITQEDRVGMFNLACKAFGKEAGCELIKKLLAEEGMQSTACMTNSVYCRICKKIYAAIENEKAEEPPMPPMPEEE